MSLSYSDITRHQRCPKSYEYSVVRNLQRKRRNINLTKGAYAHELLMAVYLALRSGEDPWLALDTRHAELDAETLTIVLDDDILTADDLLEEAYELVFRYLTEHPEDLTWTVLHVEETFEVELDGEVVTFTPDLVIQDDRGVWVVDHKTTSRMPDGQVGLGDYQAMLYSAAMREIFVDFRGFIFNRLRKKVPTQPRLTKTGVKRVADVGRIDTTYEILRDFILENAPELMDDETHRRRLAELRDQDRFFFREYVFTTDEMAQEMLADTQQTIRDIRFHEDSGRYPRILLPYAGAKECSNCEFLDLCVAELRGYNTENVLDFYEERDMSHREYDFEIEEL